MRSCRESDQQAVETLRVSGDSVSGDSVSGDSVSGDSVSGHGVDPQGASWRPVLGHVWLLALIALSSGCSALIPLKGVPVNYYPRDLQAEPRSGKKTIDLSLLRQTPPDEHLIDAGDVLGVYIEGVLGKRDEVPPVHFPMTGDTPPSLGFPIPVRDDGTISLPLAKPITVRGLTVRAAEEIIRKAYTEDQQVLQAGRDRILVSLQRPRNYNVLVIRQEGGEGGGGNMPMMAGGMGGMLNPGNVQRGTGKQVNLPAYKNDVLHALAETGGLPGLNAENAIYVIRRKTPNAAERPPAASPEAGPAVLAPASATQTGRARPKSVSALHVAGAGPERETPWGHTSPRKIVPDSGVQSSAQQAGSAPPASRTDRTSRTSAPPPVMPARNTRYPGMNVSNSQGPGAGTPAPGGQAFSPYGPQLPLMTMPPPELAGQLDSLGLDSTNAHIIRIPIRLQPGEKPQISESDVILQEGDIVFIESRGSEVFYTGGLLGGGQYMLPRDYDLDVLGAIAVASGRNQGGGGGTGNRIGGVSALNMDVSFSASDVVVLRQFPDGNQIPIRIDLNKALRDPKYRIRIQPGDYIVLQYRPLEAVGALIERNLLAGGLLGLASIASSNNSGGTGGGIF